MKIKLTGLKFVQRLVQFIFIANSELNHDLAVVTSHTLSVQPDILSTRISLHSFSIV